MQQLDERLKGQYASLSPQEQRVADFIFDHFDDLISYNSAELEHDATTSRSGEDQLFYCLQRGISEDDAISMIGNGFCKDVFSELPLEFAVEAQKLLAISLEHSVG